MAEKLMKYKPAAGEGEYFGSVEPDIDDRCLYGKVLFITDTILYEGKTIDELENKFHKSVDNYIKTCAKHGIEAKKSFKGSLNVRLGEDLHQKVATGAYLAGVSINDWLKNAAMEKIQLEELFEAPITKVEKQKRIEKIEKVKYILPLDQKPEEITITGDMFFEDVESRVN